MCHEPIVGNIVPMPICSIFDFISGHIKHSSCEAFNKLNEKKYDTHAAAAAGGIILFYLKAKYQLIY